MDRDKMPPPCPERGPGVTSIKAHRVWDVSEVAEEDPSVGVQGLQSWALDRPTHVTKWTVKKRILEVRQAVIYTNVQTFGERPPP